MFFYVPNYLESDFTDSLTVNGKTCILNYNSSTPTTITLNINSLDFKSNTKGLSDNTYAIEAELTSGIKKGDYVTDSNLTYLINWTPYPDINCYRAQMQICNISVNFERWENAVYDSFGAQSTPCQYVYIASNVLAYHSKTGASWYDATTGQMGIFVAQRVQLGFQYNDETKYIRISDEFEMNSIRYVVSDIDYAQMNSDGDSGILLINAQTLEGGKRA